ncbi:MAG TPA: ABC transporter ATP-binding protein [Pirellulales bacterium]|jgi:oligopeptide/dipeptide ABC transporter ATP-binding protein|nr:ABC transporter ATP-binding protein [Pirellulales bacterium]
MDDSAERDSADSDAATAAIAAPDAASHRSQPLLEIVQLKTYFHTEHGLARAVDGVSFSVPRGKTLAVVGESGCGKTVTALTILRLIPIPPGEIVDGRIQFEGRDLLALDAAELQEIRGGDIAMIFQEPATSLNPVFTIGNQIAEAIRLHRDVPEAEVRDEVLKALSEVRMSEPERRIDQYPHELSGGMKQRAMIAMALSCKPKLLIADEPTTALDVTIQARILDLLRKSQNEHGMSILLITHDLGVVAEMADDVVVMYAGKVVERAEVRPLFARPLHPYTQGLFSSLVRVDRHQDRLQAIEGSVPAPTNFPTGCRFRARCALYESKGKPEKCTEQPPLAEIEAGHWSACWFADELAKQKGSP